MPRKPRAPREPVEQQQPPQPQTQMPHTQQPGEVPPTVTPWAKVLNDWIWAQFVAAGYRPIGPSQLAARLGYPRQTVSNWLYRGFTPSAADMFHVMKVLGIPIARLAEAYASLGLEFPALGLPTSTSSTTGTGTAAQPGPGTAIPAEAPGPRPRAYQPPSSLAGAGTEAEATADEWEQMVTTTTAALREAGVPEEAIILAVARIRERQAGLTPFAQRLAEEKSEGKPSQTPTAKPSSATHTHTRKPSPSTPRGGGRSTTPSGSSR